MKITINRLPSDSKSEDSAAFTVKELTSPIKKAIGILKDTSYFMLAHDMNSDESRKLGLQEIMYSEYLERSLFLYTNGSTYWVKMSLTAFLDTAPSCFIQISKNMAVNLYCISLFAGLANGNLAVTLSTNEKLIVSRRYVKPLKDGLKAIV